MSKIFGKKLKELRLEKDLLQSELAQELGIAHNTLSNWELGNREPDINTIGKIADYFNVSTDYLFGREPQKATPKLNIG